MTRIFPLLLSVRFPECIMHEISDVFAVFVLIPYILYWVIPGKKNCVLGGLLIGLNAFSLFLHIISLSIFVESHERFIGDCYIFSSDTDRYKIFLLLLFLLLVLPWYYHKQKKRWH